MKRASRAAELMHLIPQLQDPQSELLLLRSCMGIAKLFFGLRTHKPIHMEEPTMLFDKELREAVEDIVVGRGCNALFIYLIILVEFRVFYMIYVDKRHVVCINILLSGFILLFSRMGWN